jgi:predicted RNA-binding Zn-ribbon protein involved in translation (DUF1610 family)
MSDYGVTDCAICGLRFVKKSVAHIYCSPECKTAETRGINLNDEERVTSPGYVIQANEDSLTFRCSSCSHVCILPRDAILNWSDVTDVGVNTEVCIQVPYWLAAVKGLELADHWD